MNCKSYSRVRTRRRKSRRKKKKKKKKTKKMKKRRMRKKWTTCVYALFFPFSAYAPFPAPANQENIVLLFLYQLTTFWGFWNFFSPPYFSFSVLLVLAVSGSLREEGV